MKVRDVMTKHVNLISPDTALAVAARRMRDEGVGCLPVGEGGQLVGIVTDRDMVVRAMAAGKDVNRFTVREIMSAEVVSCFDDQDAEEARRIMAENQVRRLPVLERRHRRLVGIVSIHDLEGGSVKAKPFQVTFYKRLTGSQGQPRNVAIETVYITNRHTRDDAVEAAIRKFERDRNVSPWNSLADGYDVVEPSRPRA